MAVVPKIYQLSVTLSGITPAIWRRVLVRSDVRLHKLHKMIQIVMGWEDYHLYLFDTGGERYTDPESAEESPYESDFDASKVKLSSVLRDVGDGMLYVYDFGDEWHHTLKLEQVFSAEPGVPYPICLDGGRACPREDCGGPHGYAHLLEVLANPEHEQHESLREWAGEDWDPENFELFLVNLQLPRRVAVRAEVIEEERQPISSRRREDHDDPLRGSASSASGEPITVPITLRQWDLLTEMMVISSEEEAMLRNAVPTSNGVVLVGDRDTFDLLLDSIAAEANHASTDKHQRAMDRIYEKIEKVVDGK